MEGGESSVVGCLSVARTRWRTIGLFGTATLVLFAAGCGGSGSEHAVIAVPKTGPPGKARNDTTYLDRVADDMHYACLRSDSLYCDSLLPLFDDTAFARSRPDLVVAAFFCDVISHHAFPAKAMERLAYLARTTDNAGMMTWHDYFLGRHRHNIGDYEGAIVVFLKVLPEFTAQGDTNGISTVSKRIGSIYWNALHEPREALSYLRVAFPIEPTIEDKYDIVNLMEQCYVQLAMEDSVGLCLAFYEANRNAPALIHEADPRATLYFAWARFDRCALGFLRRGQGDVDTLRLSYHRAQEMLVPGVNRVLQDTSEFMKTKLRRSILFARALLRAGRPDEAALALAQAEVSLGTCANCDGMAADLYMVLAEIFRGRGDLERVVYFQDRRVEAIERSQLAEERTKMASAMAKAAFDQDLNESKRGFDRERILAHAAIERGRSQRKWLLIASALMLIIGLLVLNRYRLRRAIQIERMRTRLSRDLHDDIGSTLSSINILSSVARKRVEASGDHDASDALEKISDRSQRLMRNMSDIVWSVDPKKDSLEDLLARMREFSASLFESKGIAHTFEQPSVIPAFSVPVELKNNLYLLFKEAVNNVAKHSQCSQTNVIITVTKSMLRLVVKDDGIGMDMSSAPTNGHRGNGLRNMRERAAEMKAELQFTSVPGTGTAIALELPLRG